MDDLSLFLEFEDFEPGGTPPPPYWRRPELVAFDIGADNHIDLFDAYGFALCFATTCGAGGCGPGGCEPGGCIEADLCLFVFDSDDDNDIDQTDWAAMAAVLGGPATARLPGDADASRFGNPFLFTGQRYDAATGLYHFWARTYDPVLGRWLQRDKLGALAATGDISLSSGAYGPTLFVGQFAPGGEYLDGFSLYQYVSSNPLSRLDSLGLSSWGWDDDIDQAIAQMAGEKAAAAEHAFDFFQQTAYSAGMMALQTAVIAIVPGAGLYYSAMGMYGCAEDMWRNGISWDNALGFGLSAYAGYRFARADWNRLRSFGQGIRGSLGRTRQRYAARRSGIGYGCFAAGTLVSTVAGPIPIEEIRQGHLVWTYNQMSATWDLNRVLGAQEHDYHGELVTIEAGGHTIEGTGNHPFWVKEGTALSSRPAPRDVYSHERAMTPAGRWVEARSLRVGDALLSQNGDAVPIEAIRHRPVGCATVFNLQVSGGHTYAVGECALLVHNKPMAYRRVLQTGGRTIKRGTADALGLRREQVRQAIEGIKRDNGKPPSYHSTKIFDNGDVMDANTGAELGNIYDYS